MNMTIRQQGASAKATICIFTIVLLFSATAALADGSLTVRLLPKDVDGQAAWFSIDAGATMHANGSTISVPAGSHSITFKALDFYTFPASFDFSISDGENLTFVFVATAPASGTLKINIVPAGAVSAGAKWSPDYGKTLYTSGTSVPLAAGTYPISFTDVGGFTTPSGFDALVEEGSTTELTASYAGNTGVLTVKIESETIGENISVKNKGAQWRLTSDGVWRNSGVTLPSLDVGNYTIEFKDVTGWKTPNNISVNIVASQTATRTGTYIRNEAMLKGFVVDEFGSGLDGATVTLSSNKGTQLFTTEQGGKGDYEFSDLAVNTKYTISVFLQDYVFDPASITKQVAGTGGFFSVDSLQGEYTPSNLSISGTVRVGSGGPVLRSGVTLMLNDSITTTTNEIGFYKFENLSGGKFTIKMLPKANYNVPSGAKTVIVPRAKSKENVNWTVTNTNLKIAGLVEQIDGTTPVSGVAVTAKNGGVTKTATTGSNGRYTITGLGTGTWEVKPAKSGSKFRPIGRFISVFDRDSTFVNFTVDPPVIKELKVGNLTVVADGIVQRNATQFRAGGNVTLGKLKFVRVDGDVTIDTDEETISGVGRVYIPAIPSFGAMTLYPNNFEIDAGGVNIPGAEISFKFRLFEINVTDIGITDSGVALNVMIGMDFLVRKIELTAGMTIDNNGLSLDSFEASISQIPLGPWELEDTTAFYDVEENSFGGGTTLITPLVDLEARLAFLDGALDSIFFAINKSIPINPPVFFLTRIGGGVSNLASDKPIQIEAEADFDVGKKLGSLRLATIEGRVVVVLSGSFEVSGTVFISGRGAGGGRIAYTHNPNSHFLAEAHMGFGAFPRVEINGELNLTFRPFNVWGSASAYILVAINIDFGLFEINIRFPIGGAGASFTKDELRVWAEILGARLEGLINGSGFQITRPGWLRWVKIPFDELDGSDPATFEIDGDAMVNAANNLDAVTVKDGLGEAHLFLAWEKGESQPSIVSPSGVVFDGSPNGITYRSGILEENRFAWFSVPEPEAGVWGINYTNRVNIGETYAELTEYSVAPGVAIASVEELGTNLYRINMLRSNLKDEQVELFFEPADREGSRIALAGPVQIGDAMSYDWDTSTVAPGTYSLYARVYDPENHPFLFQYDKLVRVEGDDSRRIKGRPRAKTKNDVAKVTWKRVKDDLISYYRIYYTDDLKSDGYKSFVDIEPGKTRAELDSETLKPGRRYRIAVTPVYEDGAEGPLSRARTFTFSTKKENNYPQISSTPRDTVILGNTYTYQVKSKDLDRDKVFYRLLDAPEGMTINAASGKVAWDTSDVDPGVRAVAIQATDSNNGTDVQRYNLLVSDSSEQGILQIRPVFDSNGNKAYVVSYWNPFLNFNSKLSERLPARLRTAASPAGIDIKLREAGKNWGYFSAVVTDNQMSTVRAAAAAEVGPAAHGLNMLVVEMVGKHRLEKIAADTNKRRNR